MTEGVKFFTNYERNGEPLQSWRSGRFEVLMQEEASFIQRTILGFKCSRDND